MVETQDTKDIEAIVQRESAEALKHFQSGDFEARLKARLGSPLPGQPLILFRKPVFITALAVVVLAAASILVFFGPGGRNGQVETGFKFLTGVLAKSDLFQSTYFPTSREATGETPVGGDIKPFAEVLSRVAAGLDTGSESTSSSGGSAPLRPLFNANERLKILYGDQVILKVLNEHFASKGGLT